MSANAPTQDLVLVHLCYNDMTDHSRSPSSTGIISFSGNMTLVDLNNNVDSMFDSDKFDTLGMVKESQQQDHEFELAEKVISVRWTSDSGLPDTQVSQDEELQLAYRLMGARRWKDHLIVRCRLKDKKQISVRANLTKKLPNPVAKPSPWSLVEGGRGTKT
jgi:hypothetical protein